MLKVRVENGQEILATVREACREAQVKDAAIVSLIGAVDTCCISTMPKDDARKDILTDYAEPLELSGTGEVKDGEPHIHCVLAREGDIALSGHLHWAKVETWFAHVYLLPF